MKNPVEGENKSTPVSSCAQSMLFFLTAHGELEIVGIKFHDIIYLFKYLFKGIL